jgi:hypothetical protein
MSRQDSHRYFDAQDAHEEVPSAAKYPMLDESNSRSRYEEWRTLAFTFCDCFLGDKGKAAVAARDALAAFLLDYRGCGGHQVPLPLLRYALAKALHHGSDARQSAKANALESTIPQLPAAERAVFILRGVLNLSPFDVAVIGGITSDEVHRLWTDSLLHLQILWLQKHA